MNKCFILILGLLLGSQASAQGNLTSQLVNGQIATNARRDGLADAYRSVNGNMIDVDGKAVVAKDANYFKIKTALTLGGMLGDKIVKGDPVEVNCITPATPKKWNKYQGRIMNGEVEKIKKKGFYLFVKVKGCDHFVQSHLITKNLQNVLPAKAPSKPRAVARQSSQ